MKTKRIITIVLIAIMLYAVSYIWFRQTRREIWEKHGNVYVIFPADKVYFYYFFRPLSYVDGAATEMKFHIGQHR